MKTITALNTALTSLASNMLAGDFVRVGFWRFSYFGYYFSQTLIGLRNATITKI